MSFCSPWRGSLASGRLVCRLLKNGASPGAHRGRERAEYAQDKDAKSVSSSAIGATEDVALRRPVRSDGRGLCSSAAS